MPSTQIVRRESSSQMHSGHRVDYLSSLEPLERSERGEGRGAGEVEKFLEQSKRNDWELSSGARDDGDGDGGRKIRKRLTF